MTAVGIIPARMASSRFPGKPLETIRGMPMVGHVYLRSRLSKLLDHCVIATCDDQIAEFASSIGATAVMTSVSHPTASDRAAEAMLQLEESLGTTIDIPVMIQGDEPMLTPGMIDAAIAPMIEDPSIRVVNLMAPLSSIEEFEDPGEIKVVIGKDDYALFFSREPVPSRRKTDKPVPMNKQVCVIPYRRDFLLAFNDLEVRPLESAEGIDMLRVLEHGYRVKMVATFEFRRIAEPVSLGHRRPERHHSNR